MTIRCNLIRKFKKMFIHDDAEAFSVEDFARTVRYIHGHIHSEIFEEQGFIKYFAGMCYNLKTRDSFWTEVYIS